MPIWRNYWVPTNRFTDCKRGEWMVLGSPTTELKTWQRAISKRYALCSQKDHTTSEVTVMAALWRARERPNCNDRESMWDCSQFLKVMPSAGPRHASKRCVP